jgi:hypothetical protein
MGDGRLLTLLMLAGIAGASVARGSRAEVRGGRGRREVRILRHDESGTRLYEGDDLYSWQAVMNDKVLAAFYNCETGYSRKGGSGKGAALNAGFRALGFRRLSDAQARKIVSRFPPDAELLISAQGAVDVLPSGSRAEVREGRGPKVDRKAAMAGEGRGGKYASIGRGAGDPQVWEIDLKWSLWSREDGIWSDRAPQVWRAMWEGIVENAIGEWGEILTVKTAPKKEIRTGEVTFAPGTYVPGKDTVKVTVWFHTEDDEEEQFTEYDTFEVSADEDGFDEAMRKIDEVEDALITSAK